MRLSAIDPRTITGQITGLIILSVTLAFFFSTGTFFLFFRYNQIKPGGTPPVPQFVTVAELARAASNDAEIATVIAAAARAGVPVRLVKGEAAARLLAGALPETDTGPFRHASGPRQRMLRAGFMMGSNREAFTRLGKNGVLVFPDAFPDMHLFPGFIAGPLISALTIIAICVLGLSVYAARFITAPLSSFAQAASAVGRSSSEESKVSERGPLEITRVARALNEMRERIRNLLDERTSMLTAISHDLRTPLTRMRLRVEKLSSSGINDAITDGMLLDIARMEQMLGETLGYLRDDGRVETPISVDLPSVLQTICTELADLGETISYQGPAKLVYRCKPSAITRAVSNLVDNAMKFGTRISVSLSRLADGGIQIDVADDGPGISYSHRTRVFEPFFKGDSSRRSGGEGFGLGLSIARRIVENHEGRIELYDCVPRGLRVCIWLPPQPIRASVLNDA